MRLWNCRYAMQRKTLYEIIIAAAIAALLLLTGFIESGDGPRSAGDDGAPVPCMGFTEINRAGARIAVLTGSELYTAAVERFPLATPVQYDTFADLFYALDSGKVDAALGFDTNIPLVRQSYPGLAVIPDVVAEYSYGFGTRKLDFAAYASEILRSGIGAVPEGQTRAARALGFGALHCFWKVVFPQALSHILPAYIGQFISTVKLTSVAGYISVMDLTRVSDIIRSRTYDAFGPLVVTTLIYCLLCASLTALLRALERRIAPGGRRTERLKTMLKGTATGSTLIPMSAC